MIARTIDVATRALRRMLSVVAVCLVALHLQGQALPRVALCGSADASGTGCAWTDLRNALQASGRFQGVDVLNAAAGTGSTPALGLLQQYDALLVWTRQPLDDANAFGDVLADYVDAGGGVVVGTFANALGVNPFRPLGRWPNGYEVIVGGGGWNFGPIALGTVLQPNHPVLAGVTTFSAGYHTTSTTLSPGAQLLARTDLGTVLAAEGGNPRRVDVGFLPVPQSCDPNGFGAGGLRVLENALGHVATGARFAPFGAGCTGSLGVPALAAQPGARPVLGTTFSADVDNLPFGVAVMVGGDSNAATSGGANLPLDLTSIGMPGCDLLVDPLASVLISGPGNRATWSIPIPTPPSLVGFVLFVQAFSFDPGNNALGAAVSRGARCKVGF